MEAKIFHRLADLPFEVLGWTIKQYGCKTMGELADKLSYAYNREDVNRINDDLIYAYEHRL